METLGDLGFGLAIGLALGLGVALIALLVASIIFRAATKLVLKQDVTFGMSFATVLLGTIATVIVSLPASIVFGLAGAPEIFEILIWIISFSATSGVYMFMLKTDFWKASLIQIVGYLVLVICALIVGFLLFVLGMIFSLVA